MRIQAQKLVNSTSKYVLANWIICKVISPKKKKKKNKEDLIKISIGPTLLAVINSFSSLF